MELGSWIDPSNFNPGIIAPCLHLLPSTATAPSGCTRRTTWRKKDWIPNVDLDDGALVFE